MNYLFGCWSASHSAVDCRDVVEAMTAFFRDHGVGFRIMHAAPHFCVGVANQREADSPDGCFVETQDLAAVGAATLYDASSVDMNGRSLTTPHDDLARVARASANEDALADLNGDFAAAIFDKARGSLTLVRDHCGVAPLYFSRGGGACAFSSLVRPLLLAPWASREIDAAALSMSLIIPAPGAGHTFFRSVDDLRPACRLVLRAGDEPQRAYWALRPAPGVASLGPDDAYAAVRERLQRAVVARTRGFDKVGTTLSGGLDSSSVTAILCAQFPDRRIEAACSVLPEGIAHPVADERAYMEALGARYDNLALNFDTAEDVDPLDGADDWDTWLGAPVCDQHYYRNHRLCERLAQKGVGLAMSGEGGDSCVSLRAHLFLAECLRHAEPGLFMREARRLQAERDMSFLRVVRQMAFAQLAPAGVVRALLRVRHGDWSRNFALSAAAARDTEMLARLERSQLGPFAGPKRSFAKLERDWIAAMDVIPPALQATLDAQLGVTTRFPLLDVRLLEACHAIDFRLKASANHDRLLIRRAAEPWLPEKIVWRTDKGPGNPRFQDRMIERRSEIEARLSAAASLPLFQNIIDSDKLGAALAWFEGLPVGEPVDERTYSRIGMPMRIAEFLVRNAGRSAHARN